MVPLSSQSIEILRQLFKITGRTPYVFSGQGWKNPVLSENTLNKAIRALGYSTQDDQSTHGFRATARTMLVEQLGWHKDIVDLQLDHQVPDANGEAYNRVELDRARREMMQEWSDYLYQLRTDAIPQAARHHSKPNSKPFGVNVSYAIPLLDGTRKNFLHEYAGIGVVKFTGMQLATAPPIGNKKIAFIPTSIQQTTRSSS